MKKPGGLALIVAEANGDKSKGKEKDSSDPKRAGMKAACKEAWEASKSDDYSKFETALTNLVSLAGK